MYAHDVLDKLRPAAYRPETLIVFPTDPQDLERARIVSNLSTLAQFEWQVVVSGGFGSRATGIVGAFKLGCGLFNPNCNAARPSGELFVFDLIPFSGDLNKIVRPLQGAMGTLTGAVSRGEADLEQIVEVFLLARDALNEEVTPAGLGPSQYAAVARRHGVQIGELDALFLTNGKAMVSQQALAWALRAQVVNSHRTGELPEEASSEDLFLLSRLLG